METEEKSTEPKVIQPTENMDRLHDEGSTQLTANKTLNKKELCRQKQKSGKYHHSEIGVDQLKTG